MHTFIAVGNLESYNIYNFPM